MNLANFRSCNQRRRASANSELRSQLERSGKLDLAEFQWSQSLPTYGVIPVDVYGEPTWPARFTEIQKYPKVGAVRHQTCPAVTRGKRHSVMCGLRVSVAIIGRAASYWAFTYLHSEKRYETKEKKHTSATRPTKLSGPDRFRTGWRRSSSCIQG